MYPNTTTPLHKDPQLWSIARKRAGFKKDLAIYFAVNTFLWLIWILSGAKTDGNGIPWPVWSTAGWGIGMVFHYFSAYGYPKESMTEKEYEKLKQQQNK